MSSIPFRELLGFIDDEDFQTFVQTTETGKTVTSKTHRAPKERRVDLTALVDEIEFLAATPGVHPQALASKIKTARMALMGSVSWSNANYADSRNHWDDSRSLVARLDEVQREAEARLGYPLALIAR